MNKTNQDTDEMIKVGINGFGRIGRLFLRACLNNPRIKVVGINDPFMEADQMLYLLKYDSVHGKLWDKYVCRQDSTIFLHNHIIQVYQCKDPATIPWSICGAEYIAETSGVYTTTEKTMSHIKAGAKKVIISAPAKDDATPTIVIGANHQDYRSDMIVVSNASCTTNCLAPLAKIVNDNFGIVEGLMTTIHSVTASQKLVDGATSKKDWRSGRCATRNIIAATTGAAKAVGKVIPSLQGKLTGMAFRVPTENVSVVDLTCKLATPITSIQDICQAIERDCHKGGLAGIIGIATEQVVSSDFNGDSRSCVFDSSVSIMLNDTFVKLIAYYDNEWGYSTRMVDLLSYMYGIDHNLMEVVSFNNHSESHTMNWMPAMPLQWSLHSNPKSSGSNDTSVESK